MTVDNEVLIFMNILINMFFIYTIKKLFVTTLGIKYLRIIRNIV